MGSPAFVLALNTVAFATCFAVWVLYGVAAIPLATALGLSATQRGLLVATPILLGALLRLPIGVAANRAGARVTFPILMVVAAVPTYLAGGASTLPSHLVAGLALGLVGASFAVGVQAVSSWYPVHQRGRALGIFGVGNIGTAVTALGAPHLVGAWGLEPTFHLYAWALLVMAAAYALLMRENPQAAPIKVTLASSLEPLAEIRTWRFGIYYLVTFGGFVMLSLKLPAAYQALHGLSAASAGAMTSGFALVCSLVRAPGGWFADRWGARGCLLVCLGVIAAVALLMGLVPLCLWTFAGATLALALAMGIGNAAVFRYIPDYFPWDVGTVGGLVGAIGGLGGFVLPVMAGVLEDATGSPRAGLAALGAIALATLLLQVTVVHRIRDQERAVDSLQAHVAPLPATAFTVACGDGSCVIEVRGALDEASVEEFKRLARTELARGHAHLVVDLSACRVLASAGINGFIIVYREVHKLQGALRIRGASPTVTTVLEMTGLGRIVPLDGGSGPAVAGSRPSRPA